jgi:F0F1-type ATP synthase membrane subunit c/vacuolar-type H+-ATPase subunit K
MLAATWSAVFIGLGALLAGIGSVLSGVAALRAARNRKEKDAQKSSHLDDERIDSGGQ